MMRRWIRALDAVSLEALSMQLYGGLPTLDSPRTHAFATYLSYLHNTLIMDTLFGQVLLPLFLCSCLLSLTLERTPPYKDDGLHACRSSSESSGFTNRMRDLPPGLKGLI